MGPMPTHTRHNSAISTSTALRSSSPSPSASPVSPSGDGLSRRLSWNRMREDTLSVQDVHQGVTTHSSSSPSPSPLDDHDLGVRPFMRDYASHTSLDIDTESLDQYEEQDASQHLTPKLAMHRKSPSRVYDENGLAKSSPGPSRLAGAIGRSPTFRQVSKTFRKASVRVVNIMGSEGGRVRLNDEEEEMEEVEMDDKKGVEDHEGDGEQDIERPEAMPPEGRLRGRTLGLFGDTSRTRRAMDRLLRYPWTEPAILILIIVNVVVLAIQGSSALNTPRTDAGYFNSWEDVVLLVLFGIFTLEMFARIVVTGLLLEPDISLRQYLFAPGGVLPLVRNKITAPSLRRNASETKTQPWRARNQQSTKKSASSSSKIFTEAPFQKAVAKQQSLSAQGRPYLRHSWHRVDLIAVLAFWITFILAISKQETTANRHIYIFRALSVLRAGRLLVITSGTTTILHSLKRAGPLLITVASFVIFATGVFSIIGVQSFRGSFRRNCVLTDPNNSTNIITLSQQCGGYLDPTTLENRPYLNEDGGFALVNAKGYVCPMGQTCQTQAFTPDDNSQSFDNIFSALINVIVIASVNTWSPLMYSAMDSDFYSSSLYFIVAVIVLNFWLINLLVAVVVNTFKDIRADTKRSAFGADESLIAVDPSWAGDGKRRRPNSILALYEKTELAWVALVLVDLIAQACKTAGSSQSTLDLLKNLELAFTFAFDLEMIIRIAAYFPDWRSFFGRGRNSFDLFLAVFCSIIQIPAIVAASVYPWLTVFQLLRWYRVILAFPRMKPLLITVFGSFAGLLNMVGFLFMMNFIGALMAIQLVRGDIELGDTITFSQTYNAFLGMYQIFSSENWTTVLYAAMDAEYQWTQSWIVAIFFCGWFLFANFIVLQMFIAVINENFAVAEEQKRKQQIQAFIRKTEPQSAHVSWIDRLNPYRLMSARHNAVKVDTLPPNLVLPMKQNIGADIGNVTAKLSSASNTKGAKGAMRRLLGLENQTNEISLRSLYNARSPRMDALDGDDKDDDRGLTDLLPPLNAGPSVDEHMDALRERRNQQADFIAAHPSFDVSLWIFPQSNSFRRFCQACVSPAYGERIFGRPANPIFRLIMRTVLFCTIVASITIAAVATPLYRKTYYEQHGIVRASWFDLTEVGLGMIFVVEAAIKIIADGFILAPNAYLLSLWNVLDFIILITLLVNTTTSLIFIGGLSRVTRSLRSFRALRLITLFARLRDTFHAVLFAGALRILDASILMMLYLIPFAVWGSNIFAGLLYYCNDDSQSGKSSCIGEFSNSPVDDSLSFLVPRVWANPTLDASVWAFDSFRQSILILFEIVSLEGWIDVMSSVMTITGRDQQPQDNASQWNALFVLIFNLFGGVIILTLFVSIIIENFSTRSGNALLTTEQRHWVDLSKFIRQQTPSQLPVSKPQMGIRAWCYERAIDKHGFWARGFTGIYYIHILLLMTQDFSDNVMSETQLDIVFLCLTCLYAVDLVVRFYGLGFKSFKSNGWNLFDLVVITGSFATTIPALQDTLDGNVTDKLAESTFQDSSVCIPGCPAVCAAIDARVRRSASLPAIGNLFLLWATLFLFFAILFLEVFGLTKLGNNAGTRFQNYSSFGNTLIMLAFMSTGEGWNGYMHDYTISYPRCTDDTDFLKSDCGSASWAFGLFISWNILSMYIFLNMFTGVVVESFAYVYQMPGGTSLNREEIRAFKKVWAEFDVERTGYIKRKDFVRFFSQLSGVFEVRLYPAEFSVQNLVRSSIPDPVENASGKLLLAAGVKRTVDVRRVEFQIRQIDYKLVRQRRQQFARLYNEARISEEPGKGISFTSMLMMLSHYKLIDDEKALQLDDLLHRRAKTDRVTDLVNLDRVRGLLRTIYWRRKFLASRDDRMRTLNAEADGIPAIVLQPMIATPPLDPGEFYSRAAMDPSPSPPLSRASSPTVSPELRARTLQSPEMSFNTHRQSPSLSVSGNRPRRLSNSSMLSSEDAHLRRDSPSEENTDVFMESMATSVWGDMMREAVDNEDA
ncbi:voltage-dependent calcium channel, partial [Tremellales sp. Uapishka_1]